MILSTNSLRASSLLQATRRNCGRINAGPALAPETVKIKFNRMNGSHIVKIEDAATGKDLQERRLPSESLTAESGDDTSNGRGIQANFEDFPPHWSTL